MQNLYRIDREENRNLHLDTIKILFPSESLLLIFKAVSEHFTLATLVNVVTVAFPFILHCTYFGHTCHIPRPFSLVSRYRFYHGPVVERCSLILIVFQLLTLTWGGERSNSWDSSGACLVYIALTHTHQYSNFVQCSYVNIWGIYKELICFVQLFIRIGFICWYRLWDSSGATFVLSNYMCIPINIYISILFSIVT